MAQYLVADFEDTVVILVLNPTEADVVLAATDAYRTHHPNSEAARSIVQTILRAQQGG